MIDNQNKGLDKRNGLLNLLLTDTSKSTILMPEIFNFQKLINFVKFKESTNYFPLTR